MCCEMKTRLKIHKFSIQLTRLQYSNFMVFYCLYLHFFLIPMQVIEEFGSFDSYIWNFVNNKPIVSQFRYPRQVPAKSPKAEFISKDLVKRGFRSVGPTVIYTFMQVAGLTNDHLIGCFRFKECIFSNAEAEGKESSSLNSKVKEKSIEDPTNVSLLLSVNKLSFSS